MMTRRSWRKVVRGVVFGALCGWGVLGLALSIFVIAGAMTGGRTNIDVGFMLILLGLPTSHWIGIYGIPVNGALIGVLVQSRRTGA
jgi:hypothetical protein